MSELIERMLRQSTAIYLATDERVADDVSGSLREAAARIRVLEETLQFVRGLIESGRINEVACCSGRMCACQGVTVAEEAVDFIKEALGDAS